MAVLELKLAFMEAKGTKKAPEIVKRHSGDTILIDTQKIGEIVANKKQRDYFETLDCYLTFNINTLVTDKDREYYLYEEMDEIKEKWLAAEDQRPSYKKPRTLNRQS
tara:strand:+ start:213 stop:533 length:321 start_codon:yes stop_codon:yes gene_type:complete